MSTDLATRAAPTTALAIAPDQTGFTPEQVAVLRHLGVEAASDADLAVFFHQAKRTGLDPFARQIHMIGRNSKNPRTDQWETKYTIQTGIDGYRLIARRAADAKGEPYSTTAPAWASEEGGWREVWSKKWGNPLAARITVTRGGEPFTGVALFEEYVQTRRDGNATQMWAQRPAGQLAKCAEALALRMAYPQDLAGIYVDAEMDHTASPERETAPAGATPREALAARLRPAEPVEVEVVEVIPDPITRPQQTALHTALGAIGYTEREDKLAYLTDRLGRDITSSSDLTKAEASTILDEIGGRS